MPRRNWVRRWREDVQQLNQEELSRRLGVNVRTLQRWEADERQAPYMLQLVAHLSQERLPLAAPPPQDH